MSARPGTRARHPNVAPLRAIAGGLQGEAAKRAAKDAAFWQLAVIALEAAFAGVPEQKVMRFLDATPAHPRKTAPLGRRLLRADRIAPSTRKSTG